MILPLDSPTLQVEYRYQTSRSDLTIKLVLTTPSVGGVGGTVVADAEYTHDKAAAWIKTGDKALADQTWRIGSLPSGEKTLLYVHYVNHYVIHIY